MYVLLALELSGRALPSRVCDASDCWEVFIPMNNKRRFCSDNCRKRTSEGELSRLARNPTDEGAGIEGPYSEARTGYTRTGGRTDHDLVCATDDGTPWHPDTFTSAWRKLAAGLGLEVRFHDLRHTHASQLLRQGIQEEAAAKLGAVLNEALAAVADQG